MQVPVLIIMDANKQTMALIKIRSLWGQWKFWICTVAAERGHWQCEAADWGPVQDTVWWTRGRYTGPSSRCGPDSEPFYYDRPSAISQECSYILHKCCCLSWVTTDSGGGDVVNEDQHWSRMVDVLTVYLEDWSVAVEQNLI